MSFNEAYFHNVLCIEGKYIPESISADGNKRISARFEGKFVANYDYSELIHITFWNRAHEIKGRAELMRDRFVKGLAVSCACHVVCYSGTVYDKDGNAIHTKVNRVRFTSSSMSTFLRVVDPIKTTEYAKDKDVSITKVRSWIKKFLPNKHAARRAGYLNTLDIGILNNVLMMTTVGRRTDDEATGILTSITANLEWRNELQSLLDHANGIR